MVRTFGKKRRSGRKRHLARARRRSSRPVRPLIATPFEQADPLGWVIPPPSIHEGAIAADLCRVLEQARWRAGTAIPTAPTRFVVALAPADRAWMNAFAEERLSGALMRHAEACGLLVVGDIDVSLRTDPTLPDGTPRYWAGYSGADLLVLVDPSAAAEAFSLAGPGSRA